MSKTRRTRITGRSYRKGDTFTTPRAKPLHPTAVQAAKAAHQKLVADLFGPVPVAPPIDPLPKTPRAKARYWQARAESAEGVVTQLQQELTSLANVTLNSTAAVLLSQDVLAVITSLRKALQLVAAGRPAAREMEARPATEEDDPDVRAFVQAYHAHVQACRRSQGAR